MARYRDVDALIEDCDKYIKTIDPDSKEMPRVLSIRDFLEQSANEQPKIEVAEVKRGEWVKAKPKGVISYADAYAECTQCGEVSYFGWSMKWCPNCGARREL